jgi:hypothetical protein
VFETMNIKPIKDTDGTDAILIYFSNQKTCKLNNLQLDTLKMWLNENWADTGLVSKEW